MLTFARLDVELDVEMDDVLNVELDDVTSIVLSVVCPRKKNFSFLVYQNNLQKKLSINQQFPQKHKKYTQLQVLGLSQQLT